MFLTCEKCFSADDVSWQRLPDRMILYTCSADHDGSGPHTFVRDRARLHAPAEEGAGGVTDDLLDPLLSCIEPGEPLLEYGIVEYRLRDRFPRLFQEHVAERGHVLTGATVATASGVRFGVALGRLAASGQLVSIYGPATGAWKYNGEVTYWARPPKPSQTKTWVEYCAEIGRSPDWQDEDRQGL
ncbi:MAG: hypothetical protein M3P83_05130 [Actinomycetota bacterium]|nr:hypothetical protein [Actinomycetota bacterium]